MQSMCALVNSSHALLIPVFLLSHTVEVGQPGRLLIRSPRVPLRPLGHFCCSEHCPDARQPSRYRHQNCLRTGCGSRAYAMRFRYSFDDQVPTGPYIASYDASSDTVDLTEVFRLYRDQEQAFTTPLIPFADGQSFSPLAAQVNGMNTISIPVPSRLYTKHLANPRPLEGVRVAVKDLYDIAGVPSGLGNRAYWLTYEARNVTAVSIQRLIDQVRTLWAVSLVLVLIDKQHRVQ